MIPVPTLIAYREKGPAPATKYFSGNGVAVASMCAVLHQYRPVLATGGGSAAIWPYFLSAPNADSHVFLNRVGHVVGHIDKSDLK